jgi:hypothetical protein
VEEFTAEIFYHTISVKKFVAEMLDKNIWVGYSIQAAKKIITSEKLSAPV